MSSEYETREDKDEYEAEHERVHAPGWMTATVDLECCNPMCGLTIHAGEPVVYDGISGWCHPLCDIEHALDVAADQRGDRERERRADVRGDF